MMLFLTVHKREGHYSVGEVIYTSEINSVDVSFTSNSWERRSGFTLDVRSTSCIVNAEEDVEVCDDTVQEVMVSAGQMLGDALSTHQN